MYDDRQCSAETAAGTRCKAKPLPCSTFCFFHDPSKEDERFAARRQGGLSAAKGAVVLPQEAGDLRLKTPADILAALALTVNQVRKGTLGVKEANSVGYLLSVMLKAAEVADLAVEVAELKKLVEAA
jgi:hypothetical protein